MPCPGLCARVGEALDLLDRVERSRTRADEAPLVGKGVDGGRGEGGERPRSDVEAVQMEASEVGRVGEDVLFERVVAEFGDGGPAVLP